LFQLGYRLEPLNEKIYNMKRDESLAPLSREHQKALLLAQLLKLDAPNYKGLPTSIAGKAEYALQVFSHDLLTHFTKEEQMLKLIMNYKPEIDVLIHEIFEEHEQLRNLFLNIPDSTDLKNDLATIGSVLDAHVRKEERILFPLLQQLCTPIQLQQIHELLH